MQRDVFHWIGVATVMTLAGAAGAQEAHSTLAYGADSPMQMSAAAVMPALRGRWLYADRGLVVGRVREVRVSQQGNTLIAIVARRRWLGGGEVSIPVPHLRQAGNNLTMDGSSEIIRAMPSL